MMNDVDYRLDADLVAAEGVLIAVESKICDYVRAIPELESAPCDIVTEDATDLAQLLDEVAGDHCPLLIVARVVSAEDKAHGVPGVLRLDPVKAAINIYENPAVNRSRGGTGVTCTKAAELIAKHLKCRRIARSYLASPVLSDAPIDSVNADRVLGKALCFTLSVDI